MQDIYGCNMPSHSVADIHVKSHLIENDSMIAIYFLAALLIY